MPEFYGNRFLQIAPWLPDKSLSHLPEDRCESNVKTQRWIPRLASPSKRISSFSRDIVALGLGGIVLAKQRARSSSTRKRARRGIDAEALRARF